MNFTTLAFNPLCRMNEIFRYSSAHQDDLESLGEHTNEVSMMSYLIARELNRKFSEGINIGTLLEKCLLHDADEVITGDVPRNTKYATSTVHDELDIVAKKAVSIIEESIGVPSEEAFKDVRILHIWQSAKEGKEGAILKVVDMLCVVKKSITEIELRGNLSFLKVVTEVEKHLAHMIETGTLKELFEEGSYELLRNLVIQAKDEITTIRVKYQSLIDKYHIRENVIEGES